MDYQGNISLDNACRISDVRCVLGEGLYVDSSTIAWVDIVGQRLYFIRGSGAVESLLLDVIPTVVFERRDDSLIIGSELGICSVQMNSGDLKILAEYPSSHDGTAFRSNDGCLLGDGLYLIGTMSRAEPVSGYGDLYLLREGAQGRALGLPFAIPNGFIRLSDHIVLVADSQEGVIYRVEFDQSYRTADRVEWHRNWLRGAVPDGGCRLPDGSCLVAEWDGACLTRLARNGSVVERFSVPVRRPTNCKFESVSKTLLLTSAMLDEGPDAGAAQNTLDGHTLRYDFHMEW